jgi:hypothetical protein
VAVRLCFGLVMFSGPTGPFSSEMGAAVEGLRSRVLVAMLTVSPGSQWGSDEGVEKVGERSGGELAARR